MSYTLEQYEAAIAQAEADDNPDAVDELRARRDEEWSAGFDMSRYEGRTPDELLTAYEAAKKDGNEEAAQELGLVRGVKLAQQDGNEEAARELLERLGPSEMRAKALASDGVDTSGEIPVVTDMQAYSDSHAAHLEGQLAQDQAVQANAQEQLDFAEAPVGERVLASVADAASVATDIPKLVLDTPSIVARGMGFDVANVTDVMNIPRGMHHTPEGSAARAGAEMAGNVWGVGAGFVPVARASGKASSVAADILGLGNSTPNTAAASSLGADLIGNSSDNAAALSARTRVAVPESHRVMPQVERTEINLKNTDQVQEIAQVASDEAVALMNGPSMARLDQVEFDFDDTMAEIQERVSRGTLRGKELKKERRAAERARQKAIKEVEADARKTEQGDLGGVTVFGEKFEESVVKTMARRFGETEQDIKLAIVRAGGLRRVDETGNYMNDTLSNVRARRYDAEKADMYTTTGVPKNKDVGTELEKSFVQRWMRPATALLRENVGRGFAAKVEQAYMKATRTKTMLTTKYQSRQAEFKQMVEWADQSHVKRMFMDLQTTGVEGRAKLIQLARRELDNDTAELFNEYLEDAFRHQKKMKDNVFGADAVLDAIYWSIARLPGADDTVENAARKLGNNKIARGSEPTVISQTAKRERNSAASMSEEHLATYDNPIMSQFRSMTEDQDVLELYKSLNMGGTLKEGTGLGDVVGSITRHVKAVTGSDEKAAQAGQIMESIVQGSRKSPPQGTRIFMTQAYAGTLGQVDSAMLNAHDLFTAAWRQGPVATGKAIADFMDSNRITAEEFGIGDAHVGEFREGVQAAFTANQTKWDKLEKSVNGYSDFAFTWSGFKAMDLAGKGVIMRSTLYDMQNIAAKEGGMAKLREKYGHLMTDRELGEVARFLKAGTDIRQATPRQLDILGNVMLGRLAEQQLVSMASRPLAYLDNPAWRPVFAMSGFAIRQADLLKLEVIDRAAAGDYEGAGMAAAGWFGWSVTGYVITDTARDTMTYALQSAFGEPSESKDPRNIGHRIFEGVAGPLSMNKLGDQYSVESFSDDPFTYMLESLLPPTGIAGSLGKATMKTGKLLYKEATGQEHKIHPMTNVYEAMPSIGRQLAYIAKASIKENESSTRGRRSGGRSTKRGDGRGN
jgi:hypothetical protein